jgi:hypothetical protein
MKHSDPRIVTIVTASLFATAAHAQSSVTLYGMIDNGISYVNNAVNAKGGHSSLIKEDEGVDGGSRWGITGVEASRRTTARFRKAAPNLAVRPMSASRKMALAR